MPPPAKVTLLAWHLQASAVNWRTLVVDSDDNQANCYRSVGRRTGRSVFLPSGSKQSTAAN